MIIILPYCFVSVWTYANPFIAFSALRVRRNFYDLIMTDLYLADMDGFEVQKRVREEFKLPLISELISLKLYIFVCRRVCICAYEIRCLSFMNIFQLKTLKFFFMTHYVFNFHWCGCFLTVGCLRL